jgi:hypothetical protein
MPGPTPQTFARAYFALAALLVGLGALNSIWYPISNLSDGCRLVFSQAELAPPPTSGPIPGGIQACQQYVALAPILIMLASAIVLAVAAIRFGHLDGWSRLVVGLGAVVGAAVGGAPMAGIWWASSFYTGGPPDLVGIALGSLPLMIGLTAAWTTWRVYRSADASHHESHPSTQRVG